MIAAARSVVDAARLHGPGDVRVCPEPLAPAAPGEVRLRVTAVGLCGSDLHWYEEGGIGDARLVRPLVLGHEFAGVIEEGDRAGERVVADPSDPCGTCEPCVTGRTNLCTSIRFAGHGSTDGALREEMDWPVRLLHRLPETIADPEAPLLEPLGVALHAVELGPVPLGGSAGVYGCGPIGLLLIRLLRLAGATAVVATDRLAHRVAAARTMGATETFLVEGPGGNGDASTRPVDVAFEAAGDDAALADAIAAVRPGGRVVLVGIPPRDRTTFAAAQARHKGLSLILCRRMRPEHLLRAIELARDGGVELAPLVTHAYPLAQAPQAFATLADRRGLKVIVEPGAPGPRAGTETR